jgi:polygalacturonase
VPAEIEKLTIADVDVDSTLLGHRDGIDIVDSHDVLIERVSVMSDDDAICFKSHDIAAPGAPSRGIDGAVVRLSTVGASVRANGIKFGTASSGAFRNVVVEDMLVKNTNNAAIAIANVDGAVVSNIAFRRITIVSTKRAIFVLVGRRISVDDLGNKHSVEPKWISGLRLEDITATQISDELPREHLGNGSAISGSAESSGIAYKVYDVLVSNVSLSLARGGNARQTEPSEYEGGYPEATLWTTLPAYGFFYRHIDGVTVRNSKATVPDPRGRPEVMTRNVTGAQIS